MGLLSDVQGRKKFLDVLVAHCSKLCILSYVIGIIWLCALSDSSLNARVYFSENALLPGLVEVEYRNHKLAASLFKELSNMPEDDLSNPVLHNWIMDKMEEFGLHTYRQNFTVHLPFPSAKERPKFDGVNVYGILRAPRIAGTEAVVLSVPYNQGHNKGALALMLSFASHCRKKDYWSKDIIFVVTDKAELGMQAWLDTYHGIPNAYINSAPLEGYSGSIQAALNLEFDTEKVSFFKILIEGINGQLPNLDLVNTVFKLCRKERFPAALHTEGYHQNLGAWGDSVQSLVSMVMMMFYQASGRPSGNHGLFHRYRIEALTMRGGGDGRYGSHSFLETGKVIEGIFRSLNNLMETFHQSFFFYLLPASHRYVSIGLYMPPFGCLMLGPVIMAIVLWTLAGSSPGKVEPPGEEGAEREEAEQTGVDNKDGQDTAITKEDLDLEDKVAFLRYPQNVASVVPVVMATHVAGALLFYSPDIGYKVGEILGTDPLLAAFVGIASSFVALVSFPFVTRCWSDAVPDHVTLRSQCMLKCAALILFSLIMGTLAAINFSLAFFVAMFYVPVFLFVTPSRSRIRRAVQAFLLLLVSPPMILVLLSLAFNALVSDSEVDISSLLSVTMDTVYDCVTSSMRDAWMLGTWSYGVTCLGIVPNWLLFWCLAWR